jgi:hypothetical protein
MVTKIFLTTLAILGFSIASTAQSAACGVFSITALTADTIDQNSYFISIQSDTASNYFINYPYVSEVLDCNGDTVATGSIFYFGQFGQTTQDYPVTVSGSLTCQPLTAVFVYADNFGNVDTCLLSFGTAGTTSLFAENKTSALVSIFPNPAEGQVTIQSDINLIGSNYIIYDNTGKEMISGKIASENTSVNLSNLASGIYLFRVGENYTQSITLIKE